MKQMKAMSALGLAFLLVDNGTVSAQQGNRLSPEIMERRAIMESGKLLHNDPALPEHMDVAKTLGVRTDGLYWSRAGGKPDEAIPQAGQRSVANRYIRFCDDGSVAGALSTGTPSQVWEWLTCGPVSSKHAHGVLREAKGTIRFTLHNWPGEIDYEASLASEDGEPDAQRMISLAITSRVEFARTFGRTEMHDYWFYPLPVTE